MCSQTSAVNHSRGELGKFVPSVETGPVDACFCLWGWGASHTNTAVPPDKGRLHPPGDFTHLNTHVQQVNTHSPQSQCLDMKQFAVKLATVDGNAEAGGVPGEMAGETVKVLCTCASLISYINPSHYGNVWIPSELDPGAVVLLPLKD